MIDLHVHSIFSDGSHSPSELVAMAEAAGLKAMALTDHDTVAGIAPLLEASAISEVAMVPGIELSAECARGTMHVLGYFIDHTSPLLLERIEKVRTSRAVRNVEILKKLNRLGYRIQWTDVERHAGCDVVGRPHFAAALVELGHVKTVRRAFELLLAKGRPGYADRYRYSAEECIDLIRGAGGVPVLAHPATVRLPDAELYALIGRLKECGLAGMEVYYAEHRPENMRKFKRWAEELGLICTGGTDFHGETSPNLSLGVGFGQLRVPDEVLDALRAAAGLA